MYSSELSSKASSSAAIKTDDISVLKRQPLKRHGKHYTFTAENAKKYVELTYFIANCSFPTHNYFIYYYLSLRAANATTKVR